MCHYVRIETVARLKKTKKTLMIGSLSKTGHGAGMQHTHMHERTHEPTDR